MALAEHEPEFGAGRSRPAWWRHGNSPSAQTGFAALCRADIESAG
jgi:hypothetical protein